MNTSDTGSQPPPLMYYRRTSDHQKTGADSPQKMSATISLDIWKPFNATSHILNLGHRAAPPRALPHYGTSEATYPGDKQFLIVFLSDERNSFSETQTVLRIPYDTEDVRQSKKGKQNE